MVLVLPFLLKICNLKLCKIQKGDKLNGGVPQMDRTDGGLGVGNILALLHGD